MPSIVKEYIQKVRNFGTRRPWTAVLVVLVASGAGWWWYSSTHQVAQIDFVTVERGEISQVVSVTGRVKPAANVDLSFEKSGRVASVYRGVGDRVSAGDLLVAQDGREIAAQLAQAQAAVKVQQAKLDDLKQGARPEDILVSQVDVTNAENDVVNSVKSGFVNADDAIHNKVDQLLSNPWSASPRFNYPLSNSSLQNDIETTRPSLETMLASWRASSGSMSMDQDLSPYISEAKANLHTVQNYLGEVATAVNTLSASATLTQTTLDGYKAAILAGRTNVSTALDDITAAEEKLRTAQSKLALKQAGTAQEQIDAQAAEVEAAQANVLSLEAQLAKTVIRSPISGTVTKQDAKTGEIASAGVPLVSVISNAKYEIEADIPEADIAKIKVGDSAEVTLDAYGSDVVFEASVVTIDPAETIIDGVATYKTTLQFKESDPRVKPGMTANTDIHGEKRENALYVPGRTIFTEGKTKTVKLVEGDTTRDVEVTTGLRGSNGDVEILSGLKEGDKVKIN